ncbi:MAG: DUF2500 family protein [Oscillospiraceae bacterium]|nr:DUF2500 family protein [Oscillospiraceae bacterium]
MIPGNGIKLLLLICGVVIVLAFLEIREKIRGKNRPVQTARAMVYCKHPDPVYVPGAQSIRRAASGYVYYVTFHTDTGEIVKLYLNYDRFFLLEENSYGMLKWEGERF